MNKILLGIITVVIVGLLYVLYSKKINNLTVNNNEKTKVVLEIKKRTPDFIVLETPLDKSYKNFCKNCKKNVDEILITGGCSSCNTPNIPR